MSVGLPLDEAVIVEVNECRDILSSDSRNLERHNEIIVLLFLILALNSMHWLTSLPWY